jgi:maleylacetate reductase
VFGEGSLQKLPDEIARMRWSKAMIVATPGRASLTEKVEALLGNRVAAVFDRAQVHVPERIAASARRMSEDCQADVIIALGGGSAIGVAKAVALASDIPIVAVPTTYGGSEMTAIWGMTTDGVKETGRDQGVMPRVVIYDPDLTLSLPPRVTACSGLNAIAHCVEALYAPNASPRTADSALEGLTTLASSLVRLAASPDDREQRKEAMRGAMLAGFALGNAQMALHHKLCHALGGAFDLPHAETHAVLIPYTSAYNRDAAPDAMRAAAKALGVEDAPTELLSLAMTIDAPKSLGELGMKESDIDKAASVAMEKQYPNPAPLTLNNLRILLEAAQHGDTEYITLSPR